MSIHIKLIVIRFGAFKGYEFLKVEIFIPIPTLLVLQNALAVNPNQPCIVILAHYAT